MYHTAQFEASRADIVEILLDFNKMGNGTDIPNTEAYFVKMKECLSKIILSDSSVSNIALNNKFIHHLKLKSNPWF